MSKDKSALALKDVPTDKHSLNELFAMLDIDFPPMARIPIFLLRSALRRGKLCAVYLTDGGQRYGYAIYQREPRHRVVHVLYLAILPQHRSDGLGGAMLDRLRDLAGGRILLDAEDPARAKDEKSEKTCSRRMAFYRRNGFHAVEQFRFVNFGFYMWVLASFEPPDLHWLPYYRSLYNNACVIPISAVAIKEYHP